MNKIHLLLPLLSLSFFYADEIAKDQAFRRRFLSKETTPAYPPKPFERGDEELCDQVASGYNFPAAYNLQQSKKLFLTASYLYWLIDEEGMDIATNQAYNQASNTVIPSAKKTTTLYQPMEFQSGFKVGAGISGLADNWSLKADYTHLRQDTEINQGAKDPGNGTGALYSTNWFYQVGSNQQSIASSNLTSKWKLGLNWIDLSLERPFYSGKKLAFSPILGLRGSTVTQSLSLRMMDTLNASPLGNQAKSYNTSHSWGLGPRGAILGSALLGSGWKLLGRIATSLLFTQYTHIKHTESSFSNTGGDSLLFLQKNYNCMRPILEAGFGLGFGSYLSQMRYHLDLGLSYDWNYLFSENMLRFSMDQWILGSGASPNALSIHGLTVTGRFDF